jgi:cardiolipin synthase
MTIDDSWSLIGSANWDVRSLRLNFELDLEVYDAGFAKEVARLIDKGKRKRFDRIALARGGLPVRLRDAAARLLLPYL